MTCKTGVFALIVSSIACEDQSWAFDVNGSCARKHKVGNFRIFGNGHDLCSVRCDVITCKSVLCRYQAVYDLHVCRRQYSGTCAINKSTIKQWLLWFYLLHWELWATHWFFSSPSSLYNMSILEGPDFVFYKQSLVNKESNLQRGVFTSFSTFPHCFIGYLLLFMGFYEDIMYARY